MVFCQDLFARDSILSSKFYVLSSMFKFLCSKFLTGGLGNSILLINDEERKQGKN